MNARILTAKLDPISQQVLDDWRKAYFPSGLNHLEAHLTLFHQYPGETLQGLALPNGPLPISFQDVISLGRGFALKAMSPELEALHRQLKTKFKSELIPQDAQLKRLHVTLQNKVSPEAARLAQAEFTSAFKGLEGQVLGLELWEYLGGPWRKIESVPF